MPRAWKTLLAALVCAVFVTPSSAGWVKLSDSPYAYGNGGEFKIVPLSGFSGVTGMTSDLSADTFQTFCVDREAFSLGSTYRSEITKAVEASGQLLTDGAAWLYSEFRHGTLPTYFAGDRRLNADVLQKAIWWFMNVRDPGYGEENAFTAMAQSSLGNDGMGSDEIGNVRVLNLFDLSSTFDSAGGTNIQDQLTMIPLPAPLGLALVGLGGAGIVLRRRRLS